MEATITISQIPPYSGEYLLEMDMPLSSFEWRWIKQISGYMPFTIQQGLIGGDPDLICSLAVIALVRAGKIERNDVLGVADTILEAPFPIDDDAFDGPHIRFSLPQAEEVDVDPPPVTSEPGESSPSVSLENGNGLKPASESSGTRSPTGSERSDATLGLTGATR